MSWPVVECMLQLWRETGEVVPLEPGRNKRRARVMDEEEIQVSYLEILFGYVLMGYSFSLC